MAKQPVRKTTLRPKGATADYDETLELEDDELEGDQETTEEHQDQSPDADTPADPAGPAEGQGDASNDAGKGDDAPVDKKEDEKKPPGGLTQAEMDKTPFRKYWQKILDAAPVAPPADGRILFPGEPLTYTGKRVGNTVIVDQDIYRMAMPNRSRRPTFLLVARAGQQVASATTFDRVGYMDTVKQRHRELTQGE